MKSDYPSLHPDLWTVPPRGEDDICRHLVRGRECGFPAGHLGDHEESELAPVKPTNRVYPPPVALPYIVIPEYGPLPECGDLEKEEEAPRRRPITSTPPLLDRELVKTGPPPTMPPSGGPPARRPLPPAKTSKKNKRKNKRRRRR